MRDANRLAQDYIALWNETDQKRRLALLADTWTTDASYVDPLMRGLGHREIDGLIAAVQAKFPAFRFALAKGADGVGDYVRFSWGLGPKGSDAVIKGTDFVVRDGDRIRSVTGFLDQVSAGV
jgi:SnoaL-like domain